MCAYLTGIEAISRKPDKSGEAHRPIELLICSGPMPGGCPRRRSSGCLFHCLANRYRDWSDTHVYLATTDGAQNEFRRFAPQDLVQSTWRKGSVVVGQEYPEYCRSQWGMLCNIVGLLTAVSSDHVPQPIYTPDLSCVEADPVNFLRRTIGILVPAFWTQLGL